MERLDFVRKPEIVIGLVAAAGTDMDLIKNALKGELSKVDYRTEEIRLSNLLQEVCGKPDVAQEDEAARIERLMNQGDKLRELTQHPDFVAHLAIAAIRRFREWSHRREAQVSPTRDRGDLANKPLHDQAFVLHSLKTPAEVRLLREIYGPSFFLIAAYSRRSRRNDRLVHDISGSRLGMDNERSARDAARLIERDEKDKQNKDYGQNVQDTFPTADLFVDADNPDKARESVGRFIKAFFSYPFHTPSREEYGMFHAQAAARRSADLSRQVGAAIATPSGEIITVGCNEVPRAGGGMYWEGDMDDARDCVRGHDSGQVIKKEITKQIYDRLVDHRIISNKKSFAAFEAALKGSMINDLLEFGRMIHAEMAALIEAARRGVSVRNGTMYVTTFPCHMCARHIIAAGISNVVYIEPYPKSKVRELYKETVRVDGEGCENGTVAFDPFVGVAPRQYLSLFSIPDEIRRKDVHSGYIIRWIKGIATPRFREFVASYVFLEERAEMHLVTLIARIRTAVEHFRTENEWAEAPTSYGGGGIDEWVATRAPQLRTRIVERDPELRMVTLPMLREERAREVLDNPKPPAASSHRGRWRGSRSHRRGA